MLFCFFLVVVGGVSPSVYETNFQKSEHKCVSAVRRVIQSRCGFKYVNSC